MDEHSLVVLVDVVVVVVPVQKYRIIRKLYNKENLLVDVVELEVPEKEYFR